MKKKLALIVLCAVIMLLIFIRNVNIRIQQNNGVEEIFTEGILREEAVKHLAYLNYSREEMESLDFIADYSDVKKNDPADVYINALLVWGLLGSSGEREAFNRDEFITYGECIDIYSELQEQKQDEVKGSEKALSGLSYDLKSMKKEKPINLEEWLELYQLILNTFYKDDDANEYTNQIKIEEMYIIETPDFRKSNTKNENENEENLVVTSKGNYYAADINMNPYLDKNIKMICKDNQLIGLYAISEEAATLENVWIVGNEGRDIEVFVHGVTRTFTSENALSEDVQNVIGDLELNNKKVSKVSIKPDIINGKVLVADGDYIEVDGYGKLELEHSYRIYKVYDELSMEVASGILVGYKNVDFVMSGGKICAALIRESIKAENIRVLIKTNGFEDVYHKSVQLTADVPVTIYYGKKEKTYAAGKTISIKESSKFLKSGRIRIETEGEDNKIKLLSIQRSSGNPEYRGSIEIEKRNSGLTIINELPLEEYLYAVLPSEMPASYGVEALKVQAVCARSYAYNQLMENKYGGHGAHVDDSVSFQVYNNTGEFEESTLAVKETYGKVLKYNDKVISAYYFSTSCGHTSSADSVWMSSQPLKYLTGKLQTGEEDAKLDLTDEDAFSKFIKDNDYKTYESEFAWYRWNVKISGENLKKSVDKKLRSRYDANPALILTLQDGNYKSVPIDTVGDIVDLKVGKRETGGIITELIIKGSKNTVKVFTEYNIRTLLAPLYDDVLRKDGSRISELSMLPSAFIAMDKVKGDGKLEEVTITGGGYGHGVGMSQNGTKAMTDLGVEYEEILQHYYDGIEVAFIY